MGNSYGEPPLEWQTNERNCRACESRFEVTAAEQRFWYEELRIPFVVSIEYCRSCRKKQRAHRRIIARLSDLIPKISKGNSSASDRRDAVFTIAEGFIRRLPTSRKLDIPILSSMPIAEKASGIIGTLRKESHRHDDLLPLQILFQERLGNAKRLSNLQNEMAEIKQQSSSKAIAIRYVERWLSIPTTVMRDRIIDPPHIHGKYADE
jgi:hypothetical protein